MLVILSVNFIENFPLAVLPGEHSIPKDLQQLLRNQGMCYKQHIIDHLPKAKFVRWQVVLTAGYTLSYLHLMQDYFSGAKVGSRGLVPWSTTSLIPESNRCIIVISWAGGPY